jgi:hypothetical protein
LYNFSSRQRHRPAAWGATRASLRMVVRGEACRDRDRLCAQHSD